MPAIFNFETILYWLWTISLVLKLENLTNKQQRPQKKSKESDSKILTNKQQRPQKLKKNNLTNLQQRPPQVYKHITQCPTWEPEEGPPVISPVESLLFWKLQIVSFIFSRDGLAHCFSEGGVWQNTACGEFLLSIRQNLSETCLQPEQNLWIIGRKKLWNLNDEKKNVCKCTTLDWEWGSAESEDLLREIFSLPRIGDTGGVERFGFLLLFHNYCQHNHHACDYFKKGHMRLWESSDHIYLKPTENRKSKVSLSIFFVVLWAVPLAKAFNPLVSCCFVSETLILESD